MGTITARKRKDGTTGYTAQIRVKRDGKVIHSESETFDRKQDALQWMRRREGELAKPGALDAVLRPDPPLGDIIRQYIADIEQRKPVGRSKRATLMRVADDDLGKLVASKITSAHIVDHVRLRVQRDGVQLQTANQEIACVGVVCGVARPAGGYPLDASAVPDAWAVMRKLDLTKRPQERKRRPTLAEMDKLMAHFLDASRRRSWAVPMAKLVAFARYRARRQEEVVRIRWADLDADSKTVLVRDMKHPRVKQGNHVRCHLPPEAWELVQSMPRVDDRIFPFTTDAVSASFTRACDWLEIDDLRFHDMRHEGVTRLFEMSWGIPQVASVSGHRDWNSLRRYTHLAGAGDKYAGNGWLQRAIDLKWSAPRRTRKAKAGTIKPPHRQSGSDAPSAVPPAAP